MADTIVDNVAKIAECKTAIANSLTNWSVTPPSKFSDYDDSIDSIGNFICNGTIAAFVFPSNVTTIRKHIFEGCSNLTTVTIPASITSIDIKAFENSSIGYIKFQNRTHEAVWSLEHFPWGLSTNTIVESSDGKWYTNGVRIYDPIPGGQIHFSNYTVTIDDGVEEIGSQLFKDRIDVFNVVNNSTSLTDIGDYAFCNCTALETFTNPSSERPRGTIGAYAFHRCLSLYNIGGTIYAKTISDSAFRECSLLVTINLPYCETLSQYCFYGCTALASMSVPMLKAIGERALANTSKSLPTNFSISNVETIGSRAFEGMESGSIAGSAKDITLSDYAFCGAAFQLTGTWNIRQTGTCSFVGCSWNASQFILRNKSCDIHTKTYDDKQVHSGDGEIQNLYIDNVVVKRIDYDGLEESYRNAFGGGRLLLDGVKPEYCHWYATPKINVMQGIVQTILVEGLCCMEIVSITFNDLSTIYSSATKDSTIGSLTTNCIIQSFADGCLSGVKKYTNLVYTMNQMKNITNYPWGMAAGSTIVCSDGTITL